MHTEGQGEKRTWKREKDKDQKKKEEKTSINRTSTTNWDPPSSSCNPDDGRTVGVTDDRQRGGVLERHEGHREPESFPFTWVMMISHPR